MHTDLDRLHALRHWKWDGELFTLECDGYQVDLERCTTSADVLDWIVQIHGKTWCSPEILFDLIEGLDAALDIQGHLCSFGKHKTIRNPARHIRKRLAPDHRNP